MLEFEPWECCNEYYPVLNIKSNKGFENSYSLDKDIAEKIGISVEQYRSILIKFGGKSSSLFLDSEDIIFDNEQQLAEAIKYLEELFQIVFKFMED